MTTITPSAPDTVLTLDLAVKDAPAFDFYPERFWYAVEGWAEGEICRYWRLLGHQWMRKGLPAALDDLEGLARGKVTPRLLEKFPVQLDGFRRNAKLEEIRNEQRGRRAAAQDKARKGSDARWKGHTPRNGHAHAKDSLEDASGNASSIRQGVLEQSPPFTLHPNKDDDNNKRTVPVLEDWLLETHRAGISVEIITAWHRARSITGWVIVTQGVPLPIVDFGADLAAYAEAWNLREAKPAAGKKKKGGAPGIASGLELPKEGDKLFPVLGKLVEWIEYKRTEKRKAYKPMGFAKLITKLERFTLEQVAAAIDNAMAAGWEGLFPEPEGESGSQKKNWGRGNGAPDRPAVNVQVRTDETLPEPPCDWRGLLREKWPPEQYEGADYTQPWGLYQPEQRREIVAMAKQRGLLPQDWKQTAGVLRS